MELTIIMPCLNEAKTIAYCINEAKSYLNKQPFQSEILIVDNKSTDNSAIIASECGARVVSCKEPGYGNALRTGIKNAKGDYIIYGDCDMSYDFTESDKIYKALKTGADFVCGNRFNPFPSKEAMSLSHRLGVPFLSLIGRLKFKVSVHDFHCGLRGISKIAADKLTLTCPGMEFATEIIAEAAEKNLIIKQVPITLRSDGRDGNSHLRTIKDGFRHLKFILKR